MTPLTYFTFEDPDTKDHGQQIVKCTGTNVDLLMTEHPSLMFKAIEHCVTKGWGIEAKTFEAIEHNVIRLQGMTPEEQRVAFELILLSPRPDIGIQMMYESTLLAAFLPEIVSLTHRTVSEKNLYDITLARLGESPQDLWTRWKILLHLVPLPDAQVRLTYLEYSPEEIQKILA